MLHHGYGDRLNPIHQPSAFAPCLAVVLLLCTPIVVLAQSDPCDDLDGDGFQAGPGCAVQEDCNDLDAAVFPGAPEACNGWDDDCDNAIDEVCVRTCPDFEVGRRVFLTDAASHPRIVAADLGWAVVLSKNLPGFPHCAVRLDARGEKLTPERTHADDYPTTTRILWTGSAMTAAWNQGSPNSQTHGAFLRPIGPWGVPKVPPINVRGGSSGVSSWVWGGYEYGLIVTDTTALSFVDGTLFSRVGPEGDIRNPETYLDTERPGGGDAVAWNTAGYGWIYRQDSPVTEHRELFFQKLGPNGELIGQPVMITDHTGLDPAAGAATDLYLVFLGPGNGYAAAWNDNRTGQWQAWFARLDDDGNVMTPPGQVQVTSTALSISLETSLAWTGEEFLLAWTDLDSAFGPLGALVGSRISMDGVVLEQRTLIGTGQNDFPRIAWNGRSFGMVFAQQDQYPLGQPAVEYAEIGCHCNTDGDGDGVFPCAGGDCDDSDPEVALGTSEVCTDVKDNDCDGLVDCNDPDCTQGGKPPAEIAGVSFADATSFSWTGDAKASGYDVARGVLSDLRDMENFRWTDCAVSRTAATTWSDAEIPTLQDGFYYLVRGAARTCLLGTWGSTLRDDTLRGCP